MNRLGVWILAVRPRTLTAAAAPVFAGSGLAWHHGHFRFLPALAALVGALLIQVGTNLANDYYDFLRGGDPQDRVGPVRVTQAGLLPPPAVRRAAYGVLGAAFLVGIYLVGVGGWPVVVIGLASLASAVAYTGGPFPLAYHGLGDLFVFVFFGLVAVGGTYWVQALAWNPAVLLAGAGVGALTTAILVVNNLRDRETDARVGKRTLAVRLGVRGTQGEFLLAVLLAALVPPLGRVLFGWPFGAFLAWGALPALAGPVSVVLGFREGSDPRVLLPSLGKTALAAGLYGLLLGLGLALG